MMLNNNKYDKTAKYTYNNIKTFFNLSLLIIARRLENIRRGVISNVSCTDETCTCDWSMKVGIRTQTSSHVQSYSSLKLSRLVLWHYALNNEAILKLSNKLQGNTYQAVKRLLF